MGMNQNIKTRRIYIIGAALLALFLGSMDALVMSAAMPTIVTELGGPSPLCMGLFCILSCKGSCPAFIWEAVRFVKYKKVVFIFHRTLCLEQRGSRILSG